MGFKKIAIFGYGWLGKPLALHLKSVGFDVYAASRSQRKIDEMNHLEIKGFEVNYEIEGAKTNIHLNPAIFHSIDYLIICLPPSGFQQYAEFIFSIVLQFPKKTKIVFTSSTGVYENLNSEIFEDSIKIDNHPVFEAEKKLQNSFASRLTILRLAGLIGGKRHPVNYFIQRNFVPNSNAPVNLVCLKDVIRAMELILEKQIFGDIFNIVNPYHPSKQHYYLSAAKAICGRKLLFENGNGGKLVSGKKFEQLTGFTYLFDLDDWKQFSSNFD